MLYNFKQKIEKVICFHLHTTEHSVFAVVKALWVTNELFAKTINRPSWNYTNISTFLEQMIIFDWALLVTLDSLRSKIFTFSCSWTESVIFQLLMSKINGKDLFFSLNFAFATWVMKWCKTIFRSWHVKVIYITVENLEKRLVSQYFLSFCITLVQIHTNFDYNVVLFT